MLRLPAIRNCVLLPLLSVMLIACATPRLGTLKVGDEIEIAAATEKEADSRVDISNKVIGQDAHAGALGGASAGAIAGLFCGPWSPICVPLGAMVVGFGGGAVGAIAGIAESLPREARDQLHSRIEDFRRLHNPREHLMAAITGKARDQWRVVAEPSSTLMTVHLREVALHSMRENRIALVMRVAVTVRSVGADGRSNTTAKTFKYVGPNSNVRLWIEDKNEYVANSFNHAYRQIAENVCSELML